MKIRYANNLIHKLGMGDPTTCVYQFIYDEKDKWHADNTIFYYAYIGIMYQRR